MLENKYLIRVYNEISGDSAINPEKGNSIFKKIDNALSKGLYVTLDFQNVNFIITAFLNTAIGQLYSKYTSAQLNTIFSIINVNEEDMARFNSVIANAKVFFEDRKYIEVKSIIKEELGDE